MRALRAAAILLLLLAMLTPALAQERILLFVSDARVARDGELAVTETIRVQAEGREIRRGILRDFPTVYTRNDGTRVEVGFFVDGVTRNGAEENYALERLANGVRIRIGRADRFLAHGPHEYVIRYRTTRQIGFFAAFDELYWNATGTGWTFAIDAAEARIALPEAVPFRQASFYTGPQGARGQDAEIVEQRPGRIVFRTTKPLPPRNGLTVAAAWDKGLVTEPDVATQVRWWVADNPLLVASAGGAALVVLYYMIAWALVGRDPRRGTIIPLFAPPAGMSAAGVRFVDRMGFDDRTFTAGVLDLAVNGHLKIAENGSTVRFERRDDGRRVEPALEAAKQALFAGGASLLLSKTNHEPLRNAKHDMTGKLEESYVGTLFRNNFRWSLLGLLAWVLLFAGVMIATFRTGTDDQAVGTLVGSIMAALATMVSAAVVRAR